jgi:membrane-bound lytic murein transglycosylase D
MLIKKSRGIIFNLFFIIFLSVLKGFCQEVATDTTDDQSVEETIPTVDGELVKTRLAALQASVPLKYNQYVHAFIDFFTFRKPSFTKTMLERRNYFFPIFEENLRKYDIPDEIKYLSLIESGLNPKAYSYAGAAGLWQFMPKTGRIDFGLRIDKFVDERYHVQKSTEAACKYMRQLYRIFGDWELVLAAYNTGPGNVKRAIRKAGGGGFWEIYPYLHKQTRSYVPQYVAMVYMMHYAHEYNILPERDEMIPATAPVYVSNYLNLNTLSSLSQIPFEDIQLVNPHIIGKELPADTKDFELLIPINCYSFFVENRTMILDSASKMISPNNKSIEKLEDSTVIFAKNNKKGKKVKEPSVEETDIDAKIVSAETGPDAFEEVAKRKPTIKYHTVRRGENLNQIAHKYGLDVYDIKVWNKIKKPNNLKYGKRLKLYLENAPIKAEYFAKKAKKLEEESERKSKLLAENKKLAKPKSHTVKKGENLFQIAQKYDLNMDDIKDWNGIEAKNNIQVGQKLKLFIPAYQKEVANNEEDNGESVGKSIKPKFHIVHKGDTIWSIAQRYEGTTVEKIRKLNDIRNNNLRPGQKLRVS